MKKVLLSAAVVFGLAVANNASAQHFTDIKLGIKGGFNSTNITNSKEVVDNSKALSGFNAGVVAVIPMSSTFSLRTGLDIQSKGFRSKTALGETKYNPMYLELPVNVAVMLPFNEKIKGYVGAGPYAAVGIAGKYQDAGTGYKSTKISFGNDKPGNSGTSNSGQFKRFDAGVNAIAGVDFGRVGIHAQYGFGFVNTHPGESADWQSSKKYQNRAFGISGIFYF